MESQQNVNIFDNSSSNPIHSNDSSTLHQSKTNILLPILLTMVVSGIVFGISGYFLGKTTNIPQDISYEQKTVVEETAVLTTQPTSTPKVNYDADYSKWQTYTNQDVYLPYEIKYPNEWRLVQYNLGIGFGPQEVKEDVLWGVAYYETAYYTLDQLAAEFGKQFSDKKQTRQDIKINNIPAIKFTTTTPSITDWYSESIVIPTDTTYIVISNGAITNENLQKMPGVASNTTFEKFYMTFKFTN